MELREQQLPYKEPTEGISGTFSISIENFNPRVSIYGALVVYREGLDRKFQSTIDRSIFSIPKAAIDFFQSPGPLGKVLTRSLKDFLETSFTDFFGASGPEGPRYQRILKGSRNPEGPNLEKFQDRPPGLKFSSEIEANDIFKRD